MARVFTGDFSTGDLTQYATVRSTGPFFQASVYSQPGYAANTAVSPTRYRRDGNGDYSISVDSDGDCGFFTKQELRSTDALHSSDARYLAAPNEHAPGSQESKLGHFNALKNFPGQTRWFAWSVRFDEGFMSYPANRGGKHLLVDEWHSDDLAAVAAVGRTISGAAVFMWGMPSWSGTRASGYSGAGTPAGSYSLFVDHYTDPAEIGSDGNFALIEREIVYTMPIVEDRWVDIKMQVKFSRGSDGFIRLWVNNERKTFANGQTTWSGPTCAPVLTDAVGYYWIQSLYRGSPLFGTQRKSNTSFRVADSESDL